LRPNATIWRPAKVIAHDRNDRGIAAEGHHSDAPFASGDAAVVKPSSIGPSSIVPLSDEIGIVAAKRNDRAPGQGDCA
jgi:hypothetical protein